MDLFLMAVCARRWLQHYQEEKRTSDRLTVHEDSFNWNAVSLSAVSSAVRYSGRQLFGLNSRTLARFTAKRGTN